MHCHYNRLALYQLMHQSVFLERCPSECSLSEVPLYLSSQQPVQEMEQTEECFIGEGDMAPPGAPPVPYPHFEVEPPSHFYPSRVSHMTLCRMNSELVVFLSLVIPETIVWS